MLFFGIAVDDSLAGRTLKNQGKRKSSLPGFPVQRNFPTPTWPGQPGRDCCLTKQQVRAVRRQRRGDYNRNREESHRWQRRPGLKGWGKSLPAVAAMSPARRACNGEQGEWVWPVGGDPWRFDLAAAVRVRRVTPGKPRTAGPGNGVEIDDG